MSDDAPTANAFDQFDAPSSAAPVNPFDQFDKPGFLQGAANVAGSAMNFLEKLSPAPAIGRAIQGAGEAGKQVTQTLESAPQIASDITENPLRGGLEAIGAASSVFGAATNPVASAVAPVVEPLAAKVIGLRPDLTPQEVAERAHNFNEDLVNLPFMLDGAGIIGHIEEGAKTTGAAVKQMFSPELTKSLKDANVYTGIVDGQAGIAKAFDEGVLLPTAKEKLFMNNDLGSILNEARAYGVVGEGEGGYFGTAEPTDEQLAGRTAAQAKLPVPYVDLTPQPPDIHDIARQVAPEVFGGEQGYDALVERQTNFRNWLDELDTQRREDAQTSPEATAAQGQIDTILGKVGGVEDRLTKASANRLADARAQLDEARNPSVDSPEMAQVRRAIQENDYAMRDLSPQVSAAYREAETRMGGQEIPAKPAQATPTVAAPSVQTVVESAIGERAATAQPTPAAEATVRGAPPVNIAQDVSAQLVKAGRPAEEANAAGELIAAHYQARSQRFGGALGTPEEIYQRDGATIKGGKKSLLDRVTGTQGYIDIPERELAQRTDKELEQASRGKIALRDGRATITLMKDANASTFIHETGHQWLEELIRDAADERAPQDLRDDAGTVRKWLGSEDGADITRAQHERFARGFERYMMEGVAPSRGLARVFAQFKNWLTKIYQTVQKLRSPISADIRDVFDRMLAHEPERTVIAPERELSRDFADIHEADATSTPPEHAAIVRDDIEHEIDQIAARKAPEVYDDLTAASAPSPVAKEIGDTSGSGTPTGPAAGDNGTPAEPSTIPTGSGNAGTEGNNVRGTASAGSGTATRGAGADLPIIQDTRGDPRLAPDKAGNIRFDNLNAPDDVDDALRQIARQQNDFVADRFGDDGKRLHATILAARTLTRQGMEEMAEARAKAALDTATDQDLLAYRDASNRLTMVARRLATLTHDWGYAGHAFRMMDGLPSVGSAEDMAQLAARTKDMTLFQLKKEAKLGMQFDTPAQQLKFLTDERATRWQASKDFIVEWFVNDLISGPITHFAYTIGNNVHNLYKATVETTYAATLSHLAGADSDDKVYFGEVGAQLYGLISSAPDAWAAASKAWKQGMAQPLPGEMAALGDKAEEAFGAITGKHVGAIPGKFGEFMRLPSDSVAAIHSFGRVLGYTQEMSRLAYRAASAKGLSGAQRANFMADFMSNPTEGVMAQARDEATRMVLMGRSDYGTAFWHLKQITEKNLAAKLIAPFMQIGANLLHEGWMDKTPLGLAEKSIRDNFLGRNGGIAQDIQRGKMAAGVTLSSVVIGYTLSGKMSGGGPSDSKSRALLMMSGWQPYSLKVGNSWVPYRKYLGPLGPLVGGVANMAEIGHTMAEGDYAKAASAAVFGLSEVIADESWFSSVSNFIGAARNWDRPEASSYLRNLATSFIPYSVGLSQVDKLFDPYAREIHSLTDAAKAKIPGLSQTLMPRRDIFGDPIASRLIISTSQQKSDSVVDGLLRLNRELGVGPAMPKHDILGVPLTDQQYDDYSRMAGRLLRINLKMAFSTPGFNQMSPEKQWAYIDGRDGPIQQAHAKAENAVKLQSVGTPNDIMKRAIDAKRATTPEEKKAALSVH